MLCCVPAAAAARHVWRSAGSLSVGYSACKQPIYLHTETMDWIQRHFSFLPFRVIALLFLLHFLLPQTFVVISGTQPPFLFLAELVKITTAYALSMTAAETEKKNPECFKHRLYLRSPRVNSCGNLLHVVFYFLCYRLGNSCSAFLLTVSMPAERMVINFPWKNVSLFHTSLNHNGSLKNAFHWAF